MTSHAMLLIHSIDRIRHLELTFISHYGHISLYRTAWYGILVRPPISRVREYGKYCQKREIKKRRTTRMALCLWHMSTRADGARASKPNITLAWYGHPFNSFTYSFLIVAQMEIHKQIRSWQVVTPLIRSYLSSRDIAMTLKYMYHNIYM